MLLIMCKTLCVTELPTQREKNNDRTKSRQVAKPFALSACKYAKNKKHNSVHAESVCKELPSKCKRLLHVCCCAQRICLF